MKALIGFCLFILGAIHTFPAEGGAVSKTPTWTSVYEGNELKMPIIDKNGIIYLLSAYGFDYKIADSGKILVRAKEKRVAQDTLAKNWNRLRILKEVGE